jgi:protein TonB
VEAPPQIVPEAPVVDVGEPDVAADTSTVFGGIPGGLVGGLGFDIPPPPPPLRSPPPPREPIRVGGQVEQPTLVYRVDPIYPDVAAAAGIEGVVILEAIVDQEGRVEDLKVLRSNWILDRPALDAVRQWRYAPVLVNGRPERFILTVVVSFRLTDPT